MIFYRIPEINSILKANFLFYFMDIARHSPGERDNNRKVDMLFFYYSIIYL